VTAILKEERWERCLVNGSSGGGATVREMCSRTWTLHVRALGRTWRLDGDAVGLDLQAPDSALLVRVARALGLAAGVLEGHAVDRAPGIVVVRPWAVWG